ncbi:MAG: rod shape-determining protein MreC [Acidobacteria bacterium]|nr:rod shape-determining protein MreC [Acidobacteriota bacterium]
MRTWVERHHHLSLLVAVLLAQVLFLAFQIKRDNQARLIRLWAVAMISPVEKVLDWAVDGTTSAVENYVVLVGTRQENQALQAELDSAHRKINQLEARAAEAEQLASLLDLKLSYPETHAQAAEVIGASAAGSIRTVLISRGANAGLEVNMPVLTPAGVVGKLVSVYPRTAGVLLITDEKSGVGALVADSRVHGVLKGTGGSLCRLAYVPNEEPVSVGARLLTSGQDQLFPKGLPVGTVVSVQPGDFFQVIEVQPAAFLSRLEHVLVLTGPRDALGTSARSQAGTSPDGSR